MEWKLGVQKVYRNDYQDYTVPDSSYKYGIAHLK